MIIVARRTPTPRHAPLSLSTVKLSVTVADETHARPWQDQEKQMPDHSKLEQASSLKLQTNKQQVRKY